MGSGWNPFNWVSALVGHVIGGIEAFILTLGDLPDKFRDNVLAPVMSMLGFKDEIYAATAVGTQKVCKDTYFKDSQVKLVLDKIKYNQSGRDYILSYTNHGAAQFFEFYNKGKKKYIDNLPTCRVMQNTIDISLLQELINAHEDIQHSRVPNMLLQAYRVPTDKEWAQQYLQDNTAYDIGRAGGELNIGGIVYILDRVIYNVDSNNYDIVMKTPTVRVETSIKTVITISSINITTDSKHTVVTETITRTLTNSGYIISKVTNTIADTTEAIPKGSEESSTTYKNTTEDTNQNLTVYYTAPPKPLGEKYIFIYTIKDLKDGKDGHIWIVDETDLPNNGFRPSSGEPWNLPKPKITTNFEIFPIVCVRNGFFNVNEYNVDEKKVETKDNKPFDAERPVAITPKRYKDTKNVLACLGLDVDTVINGLSEVENKDTGEMEQNPEINKLQDAFVHIGVNPKREEPIVSRVLYESIDTIYSHNTPDDFNTGTSTFTITLEENPYNLIITWTPQEPRIENEVLPKKNKKYHHSISERSYTWIEYTTVYDEIDGLDREFITVYVPIDQDNTINVPRAIRRKDPDLGMLPFEYINCKKSITEDESTTYKPYILRPEVEKTRYAKTLLLKHQITPTTVKVHELIDITSITIIRRDGYCGTHRLEVDDDKFLFPLAVGVEKEMSPIDKVRLFGESLWFTFYSYEEKFVEWYKTESFLNFCFTMVQIILIIVSIIINIFSGGTGGTALYSALYGLFQGLLIGFALSVVLKIIIKFVDDTTLKMILSAVAMVIAAAAGGGFSFAMTPQFASSLLMIPAKLMEIYTGDKQLQLEEDIEKFGEKYESKMESITGAKEELDSMINISYYDLGIRFDEFGSSSTSSLLRILPDDFRALNFCFTDKDLLFDLGTSNFCDNTRAVIV